jgi:hypothetical protein
MPNGREHLQYEDFGAHEYPGDVDRTSDCVHGCGCWMGPARSGSRYAGIDPFGKCPFNIKKKHRLTKEQIIEDFVNARVNHLETKVIILERYKEIFKNYESDSKESLIIKIQKIENDFNALKRAYKELRYNIANLINAMPIDD